MAQSEDDDRGAVDAQSESALRRHSDDPQRGREHRVWKLNEAATILWRDANTVQLELGGRRVVLTPIASSQVADLVRGTGSEIGHHLLNRLEALGYLSAQRTDQERPKRVGSPRLPHRLQPELLSLRARHGDEADQVLQRRRSMTVSVIGTDQTSAPLAAALAAAGVGRIRVDHRTEVAAATTFPGGVTPQDEGRRFAEAARDVVARAAPECQTAVRPGTTDVSIAILTGAAAMDPVLRRALLLDRTPHLAVFAGTAAARIGPLVIPGVTSCLLCADFHRTERDPAWPSLAAQLANPTTAPVATSVGLGLATVGVAVTQALGFLDAGESTCIDGTLEWEQPDWRLRRRSWTRHPDCACFAARPQRATRSERVWPAPSADGRQNKGVIEQ
jgi:hypothetical protein